MRRVSRGQGGRPNRENGNVVGRPENRRDRSVDRTPGPSIEYVEPGVVQQTQGMDPSTSNRGWYFSHITVQKSRGPSVTCWVEALCLSLRVQAVLVSTHSGQSGFSSY